MSRLGYIYSITSKSTGMVYIGSTTKIKISYRFNQHIRRLKNLNHHNDRLSYLVYYHGLDDLVFKEELKIEFTKRKELLSVEGKLIRSVCDEFSLNIEKYPENSRGFYERKHKISTKELISKANSGSNHPQWHKHPSEVTRSKLRLAKRNRDKTTPDPMLNKHHSEKSRKQMKENHWDNSGENHPLYGTDGTVPGKENCLHFPNGKHYFVVNNTRFGKEFNIPQAKISLLITGKLKHHKRITGERAPKWLVDKVLPLMKKNQFWVEIDEQGSII